MKTSFDPKALRPGTILHHITAKNADGTPLRARVNGRPQTWKTRPLDFKVPMKHGMYDFFYITPDNLHEWELPND